MNTNTNETDHMIKMADLDPKRILIKNQLTDDFETWYLAFGTRVLQRLIKLCPWVDLDLFYAKTKFGHISFCVGKLKMIYFKLT